MEHKSFPFKEPERKKFHQQERGSIFDDNYKKNKDDSSKLNTRYGNKYTNGHLKTNIIFETPEVN